MVCNVVSSVYNPNTSDLILQQDTHLEFTGSIDLVYSTTFIKCLYKARRVSDQECVFMVSILPESLPCFDWILELGQCVIFSCFFFFSFLLLLNCIVIIGLICSNNSKTLFFFFLPFYCLAFDFSSWLPFWYLQTFLDSILNSRSLQLTYNELLLYYDLFCICWYLGLFLPSFQFTSLYQNHETITSMQTFFASV